MEDFMFYLVLIVSCAEYFYRRIRRQTNDEFERINSVQNTFSNDVNVSVRVAREDSHPIDQNQQDIEINVIESVNQISAVSQSNGVNQPSQVS